MQNDLGYLNRPIFISGFHKSGTTLFLSILDGHPELVVIPEELNFFKYVLFEKDKASAIREKSGFKMFLADEELPEWSHWRTFYREGYPEFDNKKFNQLFEKVLKESHNFKELLIQMVGAFAEVDHIDPSTKSRWASKTPLDEIYFPLMQRMFGNELKFIYMVRDPRDVFTSISRWKEKRGRKSNQDLSGVINFCVNWQTRLNKALEYQKNYRNFCVFRYEDLLRNTEKTLKQLCGFLEIEYTNQLLQPTRHGKQWGGNSVYTEEFKGLSQEPIGRYKKYLNPDIQSQLEQLLKKELVSFRYVDPDSDEYRSSSVQPVPWYKYKLALRRSQLRYIYQQSYMSFRYNFPKYH
ncbi:MAG: sulfotransferase [Chloroflexi bacterium]|nr:MAG: sulfotransferase [Chloroflexota bacterium]